MTAAPLPSSRWCLSQGVPRPSGPGPGPASRPVRYSGPFRVTTQTIAGVPTEAIKHVGYEMGWLLQCQFPHPLENPILENLAKSLHPDSTLLHVREDGRSPGGQGHFLFAMTFICRLQLRSGPTGTVARDFTLGIDQRPRTHTRREHGGQGVSGSDRTASP